MTAGAQRLLNRRVAERAAWADREPVNAECAVFGCGARPGGGCNRPHREEVTQTRGTQTRAFEPGFD